MDDGSKGYNLADVFETVAREMEPDALALLSDGETLSWSEFDRRSNALARWLAARGLKPDAKVGLYMRNGPDYLTTFFGCLKARLVPFNVNYRYGPSEVAYLLDNADCEAVVVDADFAQTLSKAAENATLRARIVARGGAPGFTPIQDVFRGPCSPIHVDRSPEDLIMIYTGGTTGMPKGVMWTAHALWANLVGGLALPGEPVPDTLQKLAAQIRSGKGRLRLYVAPPLMHGTGLISALGIIFMGGSIVLTGRPSFDAEATLDELQSLRCDGLVIVGDAFARPLLDALRAAPGRVDISHLKFVVSSGMMFSREVKDGLLEFMPDAHLIDGLGASESSSFASSVTTRASGAGDATFKLTGAIVVDPQTLMPIRPGSGDIGVLAKAGPLPLGYYKDPARTAKTYVMINGVRHVVGGDHALVEQDGTIKLLGRGNLCINTAGEKVYPEEVEEALKTHPAVRDALVFGVFDPRYGQMVAAVASLRTPTQPEALMAHVRDRLAGYKCPREIVFADTVPRAANGKADYPAARAVFEASPRQSGAR